MILGGFHHNKNISLIETDESSSLQLSYFPLGFSISSLSVREGLLAVATDEGYIRLDKLFAPYFTSTLEMEAWHTLPDLETGQMFPVENMALLGDRFLVTCGSGGSELCVWLCQSAKENEIHLPLIRHIVDEGSIVALGAVGDAGFATVHQSGLVCFWIYTGGRLQRKWSWASILPTHATDMPVYCIGEGETSLRVGFGDSVYRFETSKKDVESFQVHEGGIAGMDLLEDFIVTAGLKDRQFFVWSAAQMNCIAKFDLSFDPKEIFWSAPNQVAVHEAVEDHSRIHFFEWDGGRGLKQAGEWSGEPLAVITRLLDSSKSANFASQPGDLGKLPDVGKLVTGLRERNEAALNAWFEELDRASSDAHGQPVEVAITQDTASDIGNAFVAGAVEIFTEKSSDDATRRRDYFDLFSYWEKFRRFSSDFDNFDVIDKSLMCIQDPQSHQDEIKDLLIDEAAVPRKLPAIRVGLATVSAVTAANGEGSLTPELTQAILKASSDSGLEQSSKEFCLSVHKNLLIGIIKSRTSKQGENFQAWNAPIEASVEVLKRLFSGAASGKFKLNLYDWGSFEFANDNEVYDFFHEMQTADLLVIATSTSNPHRKQAARGLSAEHLLGAWQYEDPNLLHPLFLSKSRESENTSYPVPQSARDMYDKPGDWVIARLESEGFVARGPGRVAFLKHVSSKCKVEVWPESYILSSIAFPDEMYCLRFQNGISQFSLRQMSGDSSLMESANKKRIANEISLAFEL